MALNSTVKTSLVTPTKKRMKMTIILAGPIIWYNGINERPIMSIMAS
jgi:hypothetical protein